MNLISLLMESKTKQVLIIIPFFGDIPPWIDFFFKSCSWNSDFHWLLYGNYAHRDNIPDNIFIEYKQLDDFNQLASGKLNFRVCIDHPYKL